MFLITNKVQFPHSLKAAMTLPPSLRRPNYWRLPERRLKLKKKKKKQKARGK